MSLYRSFMSPSYAVNRGRRKTFSDAIFMYGNEAPFPLHSYMVRKGKKEKQEGRWDRKKTRHM